jgi:putative endopeptidase
MVKTHIKHKKNITKKNKKNITKKNKKNITKKNKKVNTLCPIGLKPFQDNFNGKLSEIKKKQFVKILLNNFSPTSIKPENNFYDYINYQWLKNITLQEQQKYIVQVDDFRLAQDNVYKQLNEIILEYIKTHNDKLSKNLKNFYKSVVKMNPKQYSIRLAFESIITIDNFILENNPWKLLAFYNKDEMICNSAPFVWSLSPDDKNSKVYRCYITTHQFELLDINVYFDDGTDIAYKKKYREEYNKYVKSIFNVSLGNNDYNPQDVFDVEVEIFNTLGCLSVTNSENSYNKVFVEDSLTKYDFNWREFSKQLGFQTPPDFFITTTLNYLKCGSNLFLTNWNTSKWRTYWIYILLKRLVRITKGWEDVIYKFKGRFERGQEAINKSDAVSASLYMSIPFNTFLTNEYVKKYENPQAIEYVKILSNDLKIVFKKILMRNTWLQHSTKKYALKKLEKFKFVFGKPEDLREDPDLNYVNVLYDNMMKINNWRHEKFIKLEGKGIIDIPLMDWTQYPVKMIGSQAYVVNASYTPSKNSIYINLGYIQKPFLDLDERGIEYNLANIGFTISHELSHAFDDWGSKYGWDGNLNDWWTNADKNKYKTIQQDVIKQYEEFALRDGIVFDASIGIGEDLADISGLAICDHYLKDYQEKNNDIPPIKLFSYEVFYTYFAFQQKQLISKKALSAQLKTNPHPLDKYRCNVPLSRSEIFKAMYNVKKGDGMWWHNSNTIW